MLPECTATAYGFVWFTFTAGFLLPSLYIRCFCKREEQWEFNQVHHKQIKLHHVIVMGHAWARNGHKNYNAESIQFPTGQSWVIKFPEGLRNVNDPGLYIRATLTEKEFLRGTKHWDGMKVFAIACIYFNSHFLKRFLLVRTTVSHCAFFAFVLPIKYRLRSFHLCSFPKFPTQMPKQISGSRKGETR